MVQGSTPVTQPAEQQRLVFEMQAMVTGLMYTQMLYVAAKLSIADLLADGPRTVDDLAAACGAHGPSLRRVLRALAGQGVFAQDGDGRFMLTPKAEMLRGTGTGRLAAMFYGSPPLWQAWGDLLETVRTGERAFDRTHGMGYFAYLDQHAEDAAVFNRFMASMPALRQTATAYDYRAARLVIDVGGGYGATLIAVLAENPPVRGVVFDLPAVADGARAAIARAGLADRCDAVGGDFLQSVPAGGDVYILSNILHDWDDEHCTRILENCRRAMTTGGRLLVVEAIVPEGNEPALAKWLDVQMMTVLGGLQRTEAEFRDLLARAGFRIEQTPPVGVPVGLIVAAPV